MGLGENNRLYWYRVPRPSAFEPRATPWADGERAFSPRQSLRRRFAPGRTRFCGIQNVFMQPTKAAFVVAVLSASQRRKNRVFRVANGFNSRGCGRMTKFIFVTGGVVSSLGKGLTSASIGMLLEGRGLKVRMQKLDPYINVDPGTMSPYQHG